MAQLHYLTNVLSHVGEAVNTSNGLFVCSGAGQVSPPFHVGDGSVNELLSNGQHSSTSASIDTSLLLCTCMQSAL